MKNLKFIHNTIIHWIDKTDSKANIFLGIKFFIVGYFLTLLTNLNFGWNWETIFLILFVIFSFIGFVLIIKIVKPKSSTEEPPSLIYFKHLSEKYRNDKKTGSNVLLNMSDQDFKRDLSNQIISLSIVAHDKYRYLQKTISFLFIESVFLLLFRIECGF